MKRWSALSVTCALLAAAVLSVSAQAPAGLDLKAARALAEKYERFTHPAGEATWVKGEMLPASKEADAKAWDVEGGTITIDKEGLKMAANGAGCYVTLAKKTFKGPIGIRYEAMTVEGANPCDLSVRFGPADSETLVAFAFGGFSNSDNFFYIGKVRKVVGNKPLIKPGQWYTIECLLTPESVIAKVDGQKLGEEKLPEAVGPATEHDIALYVWASTGLFRNIQLLQYTPPKADARPWEEVMGKTTPDDLKALARKAGPLLGDDDFATRQAAEDILYMTRPLSDDVVREQLKSTDPEAHGRAEKLARRMGLIKAETQPKADDGQPTTPGNLPPGVFNGNKIFLQGN